MKTKKKHLKLRVNQVSLLSHYKIWKSGINNENHITIYVMHLGFEINVTFTTWIPLCVAYIVYQNVKVLYPLKLH